MPSVMRLVKPRQPLIKTTSINIGYTRSGDWIGIRVNGQQVYSTNNYQSGTHDGIAYFNVTV